MIDSATLTWVLLGGSGAGVVATIGMGIYYMGYWKGLEKGHDEAIRIIREETARFARSNAALRRVPRTPVQ